jgi:hypothetical protein
VTRNRVTPADTDVSTDVAWRARPRRDARVRSGLTEPMCFASSRRCSRHDRAAICAWPRPSRGPPREYPRA